MYSGKPKIESLRELNDVAGMQGTSTGTGILTSGDGKALVKGRHRAT